MNYGIVYLWYDIKHKRFYIGCHWGTEDDGYICSSSWMKRAYKRRPQDFKRKILSKIYTNKKELLEEEYKWLSKIKKEELGKRYYNLQNNKFNHWSSNEIIRLKTAEKISNHHKETLNFGKWNKGKVLTEETKKKISKSTSKAMKEYYKKNPRTEDTRKKISENSKQLQKEKKIGMHGKKHNHKTIELMKINNAMKKEEYKLKVKESKKNIKWLKKGNVRKMAIIGSEKYEELINNGYILGY